MEKNEHEGKNAFSNWEYFSLGSFFLSTLEKSPIFKKKKEEKKREEEKEDKKEKPKAKRLALLEGE